MLPRLPRSSDAQFIEELVNDADHVRSVLPETQWAPEPDARSVVSNTVLTRLRTVSGSWAEAAFARSSKIAQGDLSVIVRPAFVAVAAKTVPQRCDQGCTTARSRNLSNESKS